MSCANLKETLADSRKLQPPAAGKGSLDLRLGGAGGERDAMPTKTASRPAKGTGEPPSETGNRCSS